MTDTFIDLTVGRQQVARPDTGPHPASSRARSEAATIWQDAKTVLVTLVTGTGELTTVPRPVIPIGDTQLAFRASSESTEAQQLAHDARVLVQPGDRRGTAALGSHQWEGQAQLVTAGTLLPHVDSELAAKYRWRIPMGRFAHRLTHRGTPYSDVVVLVTVHEPTRVL